MPLSDFMDLPSKKVDSQFLDTDNLSQFMDIPERVTPTEVEISEANRPMFEERLNYLLGTGVSEADALVQAKEYAEKITTKPKFDMEKLEKIASRGFYSMTPERIAQVSKGDVVTEEDKQGFVESLRGYSELAKNPYEVLRGAADFMMSLPGFGLGVLGAGQKMLERMGRPFTLSDLYDAASEGMQELSGYWREKVTEPLLGPATKASEMVGATAMAPALAMSEVANNIGDAFREYPNISGALRFAGDVGGLLALGRVYRGGREATAKIEETVKKATEIKARQDIVNQIPDEAIKRTQQKILDMEKIRLENEAAAIQESLDYKKMIEEDLGKKAKKVRDIKSRPSGEYTSKKGNIYKKEKGIWYDEEGNEVTNKFKINALEKGAFGKTSVRGPGKQIKQAKKYSVDEAVDKAMEKVKETEEKSDEWNRSIAEIELAEKQGKVIPLTEEEARAKGLPVEETKEVDLQTETPEPLELSTENSPFRERDAEATTALNKVYEANRHWKDDPELTVGKYTNDVNRWLNGDEGADIATAKEALSQLAADVNDAGNRVQMLDYFNGDGLAVDNFAEMVSEAASWARRAGKEEPSVQLNMMIPVNITPKAVRDWMIKTKNFFLTEGGFANTKDVFRNKDLWEKTGFWLGKDNKWRYEIAEPNKGLTIPQAVRTLNAGGKTAQRPLTEIYDHPTLYNAVPAMRDVQVIFDPNHKSLGTYSDEGDGFIFLRRWADKSSLVHEIQHAVNEKAGAFRGSSPEFQEAVGRNRLILNRFKELYTKLKFQSQKDQMKNEIEVLRNEVRAENFSTNWSKRLSILADYFDNIGETDAASAARFPLGSVRDPFTRYQKVPGEMEARLAEKRMLMSDNARKAIPPWETLDRMLEVESGGYGKLSGKEMREPGTKLYDIGGAVGSLFSDKAVRERMKKVPQYFVLKIKQLNNQEMEVRYTEATDLFEYKNKFTGKWIKATNEMVEDFLEKDFVMEAITKPDRGTKIYDIGGALGEGAKEIIKGAKAVANYTRKARGMKSFKPGVAAKMLKEEFNRAFVDRSGNIRKELLDKLGNDGYEVVQKMYLSKGASSLSANLLKQMQKEVYRGLSKNEKRILDNLILADRMIDIGSYKTSKQFKFPDELSPKNSIAYKELFEQIEKLSPDRAASLRKRAEAYFEWMKKPLKDMLESGLISEEEFTALSSHNYRKIKLVDIFDKRYQTKVGKRVRTVYDSGIEALAKGRDTDIFEPSSEIMALEVFNRAYGRILNNEANKALLEVARKDSENPFVRVKEKKGDIIPSGWNRVFMYENGQRKAIYLSPEMSKEWITNNPEMSYRLSQFIRVSSGSPVLRTFATGINWGFALANLPRDVMHTWFAARTFENGKWTPVYNANLPIFGLQIGRDLATVFLDAALKKGRYQDYINEGGGMEFLVHQGRLLQRGRHLEKPLDKVQNFLGYFGETSEVMTRLAIRERVLRKGKSSQEATFAARDYMDFGQGGGVSKAMDNGLPYLNAAIQGTRGLLRAFKDNPIRSTYKLSQFAALTTGLYIAMQKMHPESSKSLRGNIDMQNNICIPLGDEFGFVDEEGQTRYPYIKIPLDPGQKFFKTFFEACTDKWLGNPVDVNRVVDSLKEQSPVGVTELPPTLSGALGYITNKDFWLNEDIWKQTDKPFSYPRSREEYTADTPQAYVDFGKATGLSPERTRYLVEELVTNGTLWSYLLGQGYEAAFGDLPKEKKEQHLAMVLAKTPVFKRFIGVTNPYSKHAEEMGKAQEDVVLRQFVENRNFDIVVEGYLYGKGVERKEVIDAATQYRDKDTYERLIKRFRFEEAIKELPEKSFWRRMKGLRLEARAKVFADRLKSSNEKEEEQLWKEYSIVSRAKGIISPEFRKEVMREMGRVD